MEMTRQQLRALGAVRGAWSQVTDREVADSQLTLDADEKKILFRVLSESMIWRGAFERATKKYHHRVSVYSATKPVTDMIAALNYPKKSGNELRLYFAKDGFSPSVGDIWYIFERNDGRLCVGSCSASVFKQLEAASPAAAAPNVAADRATIAARAAIAAPEERGDDNAYLSGIHYGVVTARSRVSEGFSRDPRWGIEALQNAKYKCELDAAHPSFTSGSSLKPFLECHHIVPVYAARKFPDAPLDSPPNIMALCPNCHRKVHFGTPEVRVATVEAMLEKRPRLLSYLKIPKEAALEYYSAPVNEVP